MLLLYSMSHDKASTSLVQDDRRLFHGCSQIFSQQMLLFLGDAITHAAMSIILKASSIPPDSLDIPANHTNPMRQ